MDKTHDKTVILTRHHGGDELGQHNALPNGHVLEGRYVIEARLGAGGFGITYLAKHRYLEDLWVAIKEYLPEGAAARDSSSRVQAISEQHKKIYSWGLHRFLDEARTLRQFKHPNIVAVEDFFEANDTAYMVMNYVCGRSIQADLDADRVFNEHELRKILHPLLDALKLIHRDNLYHRDISPDNILLRDEDDSPVLIDFGSARYEMRMHGAGDTQTDQAHAPTAIFKQGYSPIEQYEGTPQGPFTDIYALGATLYRTAFRTRPTDALKRSGEIRLTKQDPVVPASEKNNGQFSTDFLRAIDSALKLEAAERPQTIEEWSDLFGITEQEQAEAATQVAKRPGRRPLWTKAAVTALLLVGFGAGLWWYQAPQQDPIPTDVPSLLARAAEELEKSPFDAKVQDRARRFYLSVLNQDRGNARALAGYSAANNLNQFANALSIEDRTKATVLLANAETELQRAGANHKALNPGWKRIELLHKLTAIRASIPGLQLAADDWRTTEDLIEKINELPGGKPLAEAARNGLQHLRAIQDAVDSGQFTDAYTRLADADKAFATLKITDPLSVKVEIEQAEAGFKAQQNAQVSKLLKTASVQLQESPLTNKSLRGAMQTYEQILSINGNQSDARTGRAMLDRLLSGFSAMKEGNFEAAAQFIDSAEKIAVNSGIRDAPITAIRDRLKTSQRNRSLAQQRAKVETLLSRAATQLARMPLDDSALTRAKTLYGEVLQTSTKEAALAAQQRQANQGLELATVLQQVSKALQTEAFVQARDHLQAVNVPILMAGIAIDPETRSRIAKLIDTAEIDANIRSADAVFAQKSLLEPKHLDAIEQHARRALALHGGHAHAAAMVEIVNDLHELNKARNAKDFDRAAHLLRAAQDRTEKADLDVGQFATLTRTVHEEGASWARGQREKSKASLLQLAFSVLSENPFSADAWSSANRVFQAIEAMEDAGDTAAKGKGILSEIRRSHSAMNEGNFDLATQSIETAEQQLKAFGDYGLDTARSAITAAQKTQHDAIRSQVSRHLSAATSILGEAKIDAAALASIKRHLDEAQKLQPGQTRIQAGQRVIDMLQQYLEALATNEFDKAQGLLEEADALAQQAGLANGLRVREGKQLAQSRNERQRQQTAKKQAELLALATSELKAGGLDDVHLENAAQSYRQAIELNKPGLADPAMGKQATAGLESVFLLQAFKAEMADRQYEALQQTLRELAGRLDEAGLDLAIVGQLEATARDSETAWRNGEASRLLNATDWLDQQDLLPIEQQLTSILQIRPDEPSAVLSLKGLEQLRGLMQARKARKYDEVMVALNAATQLFSKAGLDGANLEGIHARMAAEQKRWSRLTRDRNLNSWTSIAVREINQTPFSDPAWERAEQAARKILAQRADDPRGLAVTTALDQLRKAKDALESQEFGTARRFVSEARTALVAIGLVQPLQRAADEIETAVQHSSSTELAKTAGLIAQAPLTDNHIKAAQSHLQWVLDNNPDHQAAQTAVVALDKLVNARTAIRATRYATAETVLDDALKQLATHSTPGEALSPQLISAHRREQEKLADTRPSPGSVYRIISTALGQITRNPLDLENLASSEQLLRDVLGMQADEPIALSGLQAIGHLRASAKALAGGQSGSARTELHAAEGKLASMGLAPGTLLAAWQAIDRASAKR